VPLPRNTIGRFFFSSARIYLQAKRHFSQKEMSLPVGGGSIPSPQDLL